MGEILQEIQPSNLHQEWGLVLRSAGWVRQKEPLSQPPLLFTLGPLPGHLSDDGGRVSPAGGLAGVAQSEASRGTLGKRAAPQSGADAGARLTWLFR